MKKIDEFSNLHPLVNFLFLVSVLIFTMIFMNPYFLLITLISSSLYNIYIYSFLEFVKKLKKMIFLFIFIIISNPLFNHAGVSILFYLGSGNPVTLESIIFAICSATMFVSVIMWFSIYNKIMTSDKFIYLFSGIMPSMSLIFSMALRFVPRYIQRAKIINQSVIYIQADKKENFVGKIKRGAKVFSALVSSALEESIITADSMKARGYGLKKRSAYSNYQWTKKDRNFLILNIIFISTFIYMSLNKFMDIQFFPSIKMAKFNIKLAICLIFYTIYLNCPLIFNLVEDKKWQILRSKI